MNDSSLRDHRLLNIVLILKAIFPITKKFKMAMPMITQWEDRTFFGNDPIIRTAIPLMTQRKKYMEVISTTLHLQYLEK